MINGCETCKRCRDCESDPSVCEEYEVDEVAYVAANLAEMMRNVDRKFKRVKIERIDGYKVIVVLDREIEDAEKDAAVALLSAQIRGANQQDRLLKQGEIQVIFEVDSRIPDGWPPEAE